MSEQSTMTSALMSTEQLIYLYDILEEEERPYESVIMKSKEPGHTVTLYVAPEDKKHFADILKSIKDGIKA